MPEPTAGLRTVRRRSWRPAGSSWLTLQAFEQSDHPDQSCSPQSASQEPTPHACRSSAAGHAVPPCFALESISRKRERVPPPHWTGQGDQGPQSPISQSLGHGSAPHATVARSGGHGSPRASGGDSIKRKASLWPAAPPSGVQVCVHGPSVHSETTQSLIRPLKPSDWYSTCRSVRIFASSASFSARPLAQSLSSLASFDCSIACVLRRMFCICSRLSWSPISRSRAMLPLTWWRCDISSCMDS
mmetsp:Transcript_14496/g.38250  ORF Transcript_14496/g.38250 Transcript_14496/m.38250 type:complete len:244 (+) Transcript_14496:708-1439(+)